MKSNKQITRVVLAIISTLIITDGAFASDLPDASKIPALMQETIVFGTTPTKQSKFSEALCNLQNVKEIRIVGHEISFLPNCIGNFYRTIRSIDLSRNKLTAIPNSIGSLSSLEKIDLSSNQLKDIPSQIGEAKNLRTINFQLNQLESLPDSIGNATSLTSLNLSGNKIVTLPDSLAYLTSLEELDLRNNKITETPKFLPFLVNLRKLWLTGNQLPESEKEVIRAIFKGREGILDI